VQARRDRILGRAVSLCATVGGRRREPKPLNVRPIFLIATAWAGVLRHRQFDLADVRIPY
jgi:hypothetical protein